MKSLRSVIATLLVLSLVVPLVAPLSTVFASIDANAFTKEEVVNIAVLDENGSTLHYLTLDEFLSYESSEIDYFDSEDSKMYRVTYRNTIILNDMPIKNVNVAKTMFDGYISTDCIVNSSYGTSVGVSIFSFGSTSVTFNINEGQEIKNSVWYEYEIETSSKNEVLNTNVEISYDTVYTPTVRAGDASGLEVYETVVLPEYAGEDENGALYVNKGDVIEYAIHISNLSDGPIDSISIKDAIPEGTEFVEINWDRSSPDINAYYDSGANEVIWNIDVLHPMKYPSLYSRELSYEIDPDLYPLSTASDHRLHKIAESVGYQSGAFIGMTWNPIISSDTTPSIQYRDEKLQQLIYDALTVRAHEWLWDGAPTFTFESDDAVDVFFSPQQLSYIRILDGLDPKYHGISSFEYQKNFQRHGAHNRMDYEFLENIEVLRLDGTGSTLGGSIFIKHFSGTKYPLSFSLREVTILNYTNISTLSVSGSYGTQALGLGLTTFNYSTNMLTNGGSICSLDVSNNQLTVLPLHDGMFTAERNQLFCYNNSITEVILPPDSMTGSVYNEFHPRENPLTNVQIHPNSFNGTGLNSLIAWEGNLTGLVIPTNTFTQGRNEVRLEKNRLTSLEISSGALSGGTAYHFSADSNNLSSLSLPSESFNGTGINRLSVQSNLGLTGVSLPTVGFNGSQTNIIALDNNNLSSIILPENSFSGTVENSLYFNRNRDVTYVHLPAGSFSGNVSIISGVNNKLANFNLPVGSFSGASNSLYLGANQIHEIDFPAGSFNGNTRNFFSIESNNLASLNFDGDSFTTGNHYSLHTRDNSLSSIKANLNGIGHVEAMRNIFYDLNKLPVVSDIEESYSSNYIPELESRYGYSLYDNGRRLSGLEVDLFLNETKTVKLGLPTPHKIVHHNSVMGFTPFVTSSENVIASITDTPASFSILYDIELTGLIPGISTIYIAAWGDNPDYCFEIPVTVNVLIPDPMAPPPIYEEGKVLYVRVKVIDSGLIESKPEIFVDGIKEFEGDSLTLKAGSSGISIEKNPVNLDKDSYGNWYVLPGDEIEYVLEITNIGDTGIANFTVVDQLPDNIIVNEDSLLGAGGNLIGDMIEWTFDFLEPQESLYITFTLSVDSEWNSNVLLRNHALVRKDGEILDSCDAPNIFVGDPDMSNIKIELNAYATLVLPEDLGLADADTPYIRKGDIVAYQLRVQNTGDELLSDVNLRAVLPDNLEFVEVDETRSSASVHDVRYNNDRHELIWNLGVAESIDFEPDTDIPSYMYDASLSTSPHPMPSYSIPMPQLYNEAPVYSPEPLDISGFDVLSIDEWAWMSDITQESFNLKLDEDWWVGLYTPTFETSTTRNIRFSDNKLAQLIYDALTINKDTALWEDAPDFTITASDPINNTLFSAQMLSSIRVLDGVAEEKYHGIQDLSHYEGSVYWGGIGTLARGVLTNLEILRLDGTNNIAPDINIFPSRSGFTLWTLRVVELRHFYNAETVNVPSSTSSNIQQRGLVQFDFTDDMFKNDKAWLNLGSSRITQLNLAPGMFSGNDNSLTGDTNVLDELSLPMGSFSGDSNHLDWWGLKKLSLPQGSFSGRYVNSLNISYHFGEGFVVDEFIIPPGSFSANESDPSGQYPGYVGYNHFRVSAPISRIIIGENSFNGGYSRVSINNWALDEMIFGENSLNSVQIRFDMVGYGPRQESSITELIIPSTTFRGSGIPYPEDKPTSSSPHDYYRYAIEGTSMFNELAFDVLGYNSIESIIFEENTATDLGGVSVRISDAPEFKSLDFDTSESRFRALGIDLFNLPKLERLSFEDSSHFDNIYDRVRIQINNSSSSSEVFLFRPSNFLFTGQYINDFTYQGGSSTWRAFEIPPNSFSGELENRFRINTSSEIEGINVGDGSFNTPWFSHNYFTHMEIYGLQALTLGKDCFINSVLSLNGDSPLRILEIGSDSFVDSRLNSYSPLELSELIFPENSFQNSQFGVYSGNLVVHDNAIFGEDSFSGFQNRFHVSGKMTVGGNMIFEKNSFHSSVGNLIVVNGLHIEGELIFGEESFSGTENSFISSNSTIGKIKFLKGSFNGDNNSFVNPNGLIGEVIFERATFSNGRSECMLQSNQISQVTLNEGSFAGDDIMLNLAANQLTKFAVPENSFIGDKLTLIVVANQLTEFIMPEGSFVGDNIILAINNNNLSEVRIPTGSFSGLGSQLSAGQNNLNELIIPAGSFTGNDNQLDIRNNNLTELIIPAGAFSGPTSNNLTVSGNMLGKLILPEGSFPNPNDSLRVDNNVLTYLQLPQSFGITNSSNFSIENNVFYSASQVSGPNTVTRSYNFNLLPSLHSSIRQDIRPEARRIAVHVGDTVDIKLMLTGSSSGITLQEKANKINIANVVNNFDLSVLSTTSARGSLHPLDEAEADGSFMIMTVQGLRAGITTLYANVLGRDRTDAYRVPVIVEVIPTGEPLPDYGNEHILFLKFIALEDGYVENDLQVFVDGEPFGRTNRMQAYITDSDVTLTKNTTNTSGTVSRGDRIEYTLTVTNSSSLPHSNLTITDVLDPNLTLINTSLNSGVNVSDQIITWSLPRIESGESLELTLITEVKHTATIGSIIRNEASIVDASNVTVITPPIDITVVDRLFTLTYNANGGQGTLPSKSTYDDGHSVPITSIKPTRAGYIFVDWNTASNGTGSSYRYGDHITMTDNITLYAQWDSRALPTSYRIDYYGYPDNSFIVMEGQRYGENTPLLIPNRQGYDFDGWWSGPGGTGMEVTENTIASETSPKILYPKWISIVSDTYRVFYDVDGDITLIVDLNIYYQDDEVIVTNIVPSSDDKQFSDWNTQADGKGVSYKAGDTFLIRDSDVTLYAMWEPSITVYQINYYGYPDNSFTVKDGQRYGENKPLLIPRREEYDFGGWWSEPNGEGIEVTEDTIASETSPKTLYPKWYVREIDTYKVFYSVDGDETIIVDSNIYTSGDQVAVTDQIPHSHDSDRRFSDWNTQADGEGVSYKNGDTFLIEDRDIILYAMWESIPTYLVEYDGYPDDSFVVIKGQRYGENKPLLIPSRQEYDFGGWWSEPNGEGIEVTEDTIASETSPKILYPKWHVREVDTYKVFYSVDGDITVIVDNTVYSNGDQVTITDQIPDVHNNNKQFLDWNTQADGEGISYKAGDTFLIRDSDVTLYATWELIPTYLIEYDGYPDDSFVVIEGQRYGEEKPLLLPSRRGYDFGGWWSEPNGKGTEVTEDTIASETSPKVLYPKWLSTATDTHRLFYSIDGDTTIIVDPVLYDTGAIVTITHQNPSSRRGWDFKGWSINPNSPIASYTAGSLFTISNDTTLYAVFDRKQYIITYEGYPDQLTLRVDSEIYGSLYIPPNTATHDFWYWSATPDGLNRINPENIVTEDSPKHLYPVWITRDNLTPDIPTFTLTYQVDEYPDLTHSTTYPSGYLMTITYWPHIDGSCGIVGWSYDGVIYKKYDTIQIDRNIILKAVLSDDCLNMEVDENEHDVLVLERDHHIRYIFGYPDGTVRPDAFLTRAEAAQIFFNLTVADDKNSLQKSKHFSDVDENDWFYQAVIYLASNGILTGYPDESFRPNENISRAEFATIASRFDDLVFTEYTRFTDVSRDHWASKWIFSAEAKGWIQGYPDNTFRPEQSITRAEVVALVNRVLNRGIHLDDIPLWVEGYSDITRNHWAYADIIEASNDHEYGINPDGSEFWIE